MRSNEPKRSFLDGPWTCQTLRKELEVPLRKAETKGRILCVDIDFEKGGKFACPECGKECSVYDSEVKQWGHLNYWQHATYLRARVPRIECSKHRVK